MRDRPDVLDTLLRQVRVTASAFGRVELGAPWGVRLAARDTVALHHVLDGELWAGEHPVRAGDLLLLPAGGRHTLRHAPGAPVVDEPAPAGPGPLTVRRRYGGDGPRTVLLCAELSATGAGLERLAGVLPPVVVLRDVPTLRTLLDLLRYELARPGSGVPAVSSRLAELLLLQAIRAAGPVLSWAALTDGRIARALDAMYTSPGHPWTVLTLARVAGMGRTAFAERFRDLVGQSPVAHLTAWRLSVARDLLRSDPALTLHSVARTVGYADEFAFSAAFRRESGLSPGAYRTTAVPPG